MNFKEMGDYVVIKKTYFQKLQKSHEQHEKKNEFSRNYMRKKYSEEKLKKELFNCSVNASDYIFFHPFTTI